jgi:hypothetical protein
MMCARFTILVVWSLVLPFVSAPAQTPQSKTSSRTATGGANASLIATPQDAKRAIQEGILGSIASKARSSLRNYPSPAQIRRIGNPKIRNVLERGRNLLEAAKSANRWNPTRLSGFASQVDQYLKEAEAAANSSKPMREQREDCAATKDKCNQGCHDRDAGYFCFFDCRLNYLICLAGTIFNPFETTQE